MFECHRRVARFTRLKDRPIHLSRVRIEFDDALTIDLRSLGTFHAKDLDQHAVGIETIRISAQERGGNVCRVVLLPASIMGNRKQSLHVTAARVLLQNAFDLGDRLRIQLALHIHVRQRAARHANTRGLDAVPAPIQPLQFGLYGGIGRLILEGAFHVPDRIVQFTLLVADDAHAHVRDEIVRFCNQHARENVHRFRITFLFEIQLAKQAIGFEVFGERFQDVSAMRRAFFKLAAVKHLLDFAVIRPQGYFRHVLCTPMNCECSLVASMPHS